MMIVDETGTCGTPDVVIRLGAVLSRNHARQNPDLLSRAAGTEMSGTASPAPPAGEAPAHTEGLIGPMQQKPPPPAFAALGCAVQSCTATS